MLRCDSYTDIHTKYIVGTDTNKMATKTRSCLKNHLRD